MADTGDKGFVAVMAVRHQTAEDGRARLELDATQLTVSCLRPGKPAKRVVSAEVRKQGENLSVCEADVEQDDRPLVHAIATFACCATDAGRRVVRAP